MPRCYRRTVAHPHYSQARLTLVAAELRSLLASAIPDVREAIALAGCPLPPGDGWRAWAWCMPRLAGHLNDRLGRGRRAGQCSAAAWRLLDAGEIEVVAASMRRRRGRIVFVRLRSSGSSAEVFTSPLSDDADVVRSAGRMRWGVYSPGRVRLAEDLVLQALATPCTALEFMAFTSRTPPPGDDWRPWPLIAQRFRDRSRGIFPSPTPRLPAAAAWSLAEAKRIEIAVTPLCGRPRGRLRFARLSPSGEVSC